MNSWNLLIFHWLNGPADPNGVVLGVALVLAESPPVVVPLLLVGLWIWGPQQRRGGLLTAALAGLLGEGINKALGFIWFEPRPFVTGIGHMLMTHVPDNSFPSDHATLVWAVGGALIATAAAPRCGVAVCIYGVGVAWSRVFLGVHFPADMAASALIGLICTGVAYAGNRTVTVWLLPPANRLYAATLRVTRIPVRFIPRPTDGDLNGSQCCGVGAYNPSILIALPFPLERADQNGTSDIERPTGNSEQGPGSDACLLDHQDHGDHGGRNRC